MFMLNHYTQDVCIMRACYVAFSLKDSNSASNPIIQQLLLLSYAEEHNAHRHVSPPSSHGGHVSH